MNFACLMPPTSVRNPGWTGTPKPAVWVTAVNFVTESKLALLASHNRPMSLRDQVLLQGIRPYSESGMTEKIAGYFEQTSQNNHLVKVWMPSCFIDQRWGEVRKESKKTIYFLQIPPRVTSLGPGDVLISFFLPCAYRWTGFWTKAL